MAIKVQVVFDCADPDRLARFWVDALGYEFEAPPAGFESWKAFDRSIGVPEEELHEGSDPLVDPSGVGPRMWFHKVPEPKVVKNRLHLDLHVSGGESVPMDTRRSRVNAAAERLVGLGARTLEVLEQPGLEHYAMAMEDPEGNEFDLN